MLTKKYIKYSPEITFDVFEKIYNKLIDSGWQCVDGNSRECYDDFSNAYPILIESTNDTKKFVAYDSPDNKSTEISYTSLFLSSENLLERARREYPVGCTFKSAFSGALFTTDKSFTVSTQGDIVNSTGIVYNKAINKWAEIIPVKTVSTETTKLSLLEEAKLKYKKGVQIKSVYSGSTYTLTSDELFIGGGGDIQGKSNGSEPVIFEKKSNSWSEIVKSLEVSKHVFKIGDIVRVTERHSDNSVGPGHIGKLTKVDTSDVPYQVDGTWCKNVELAEVQNIPSSTLTPNFKIGDKVRVTKVRSSSNNKAQVGYVGILTHMDSSAVPYAVDSSWCVDIELVEEPFICSDTGLIEGILKPWWKTLKDGDFVVSLIDWTPFRNKNFIYKINDQASGDDYIRYFRNDGSQGGTNNVESFRLATSEEILMYKKNNKPCNVTIKEVLPTDAELLEYANKHFIVGTKFISSIKPDNNIERTCKYYYPNTQTSFNWRISAKDGVRVVHCRSGMNNDKSGCSNPYIYTDQLGWVKITFDASLIKPKIGTAVKVTTQEEWNIVLYTLRPIDRYYNEFNNNPKAIDISSGSFASVDYFVEKNYEILSFSEWCIKYSINPRSSKHPIGSYVVFIKKYGSSKIGDIDKVISLSRDLINTEKEGTCTTDSEYVKGFINYSDAKAFSDQIKSIDSSKFNFKLGDIVLYKGKESIIDAICYSPNYYIVTCADGWPSSNNGYTINEGKLDPTKKYNYACEESLSILGRKSAVIPQEESDKIRFISDTLDIQIKRRIRTPKKQTELKFTNN